jgi:hypothetical protein
VKSQLVEEEVSSLETRVPFRNGHNFGSDRWISHKFSQEFPDAVFLGVDVKLLLGEAEVSSLQTRVSVRTGITLDPTVGSPSNIYRSLWTLFFLE